MAIQGYGFLGVRGSEMKEIVSRILKEEQEMRSRLEKSQAESSDFVERARRQGAAMIENTTAELKAAADKSREETLRSFYAEKEKILADTKNEAVELREKRSRDIPQLAQQIFNQVIEIKI